jgi:hypothetical protein
MMLRALQISSMALALLVMGCGDDDESGTCSFGGEACDAYAFYKVTEDTPIFEEPGPHGYMLVVRVSWPGADGAYFEYAEQGRQERSNEALVVLDEADGGARPFPPLTQLIVPDSHPRGVQGSVHWWGAGEVERRVDFDARRIELEFGSMTFTNLDGGGSWRIEGRTVVSESLDVLCWTPEQEPAPVDSEFCARELPDDI